MNRRLFNSPLGISQGLSFKNNPAILAAAIPAAIGAVGGFASTAASNSFNRWSVTEQMRFQNQMYDKQRQDQLDDQKWQEASARRMFDYTNEYNSPSNQMARYREAGLNPYIHSTAGALTSGNASPVSQPSTSPRAIQGNLSIPSFDASGISNGMSAVGESLFRATELNQQKLKIQGEISRMIPELRKFMDDDELGQVIRNVYGVNGNINRIDSFVNAELERVQGEAVKSRVEGELAVKYGDKQAAQMYSLAEYQMNKYEAEFKQIQENIENMRVERNLSRVSIKRVESEIQEIASKIVVNIASAWNLRKQGEKFVADTKTVNAMREYLVSTARSDSRLRALQSYLSGADPFTNGYNYWHGKHQESVVAKGVISDALDTNLIEQIFERALNGSVTIGR